MENQSKSTEEILNALPQCEIDSGVFKYVLLLVEIDGQQKYFVRGYKNCPYHADCFARFRQDLKQIINFAKETDNYEYFEYTLENNKKLLVTCTGGGRISHENGKIEIYGYSQGFGLAKHEISLDICKQAYQDYDQNNFSWNNEGY